MTKREVEEIVMAYKRTISLAIQYADDAYAAKLPDSGDKWQDVACELCSHHSHWHMVWRNTQA